MRDLFFAATALIILAMIDGHVLAAATGKAFSGDALITIMVTR